MSERDDYPSLHPTRIEIPVEIRRYLVTLLNQTLACTVDLRSQVKQAFWNVKGKDGVQLQALFERLAAELDVYADLMADRLVVLGGVALGTARTATAHSPLPEYPGALAAGDAHALALAERVALYTTAVRDAIAQAADVGDGPRRPSTPTSRAESRVACAPWNRTSTREHVTGPEDHRPHMRQIHQGWT